MIDTGTGSEQILDAKIRTDFFAIADTIGCKGKIANFVSAINDGGNEYPLFLLTPLSSTEDFTEEHQEDIKVIFYIFKLNQNEQGATLTEAELWSVWGRLRQLAKAFKKELLTNYLETYIITSKYQIDCNAFGLGDDDTVFVKVRFTMRVLMSC